ncbi:MAG: PAS domain S-box protein [Desulfurivibrionaceae bacterium]|jgi:PAS domain S-box-containing protein
MLDQAFPALIQNAALLLAMAFVYDVTTSRYRLKKPGLPVQLFIGMTLGVLGIIIMLSPWRYVPGIVFDTRSVLLGVSGLFFGVVPTAVAMAMTAAFRISQGGAAAWAGVAVILTTGTIGIAWRHHRSHPLKDISAQELYLFGLLIHLDMLAMMLTLPWPTAKQVLAQITLPVLTIYPLATALLGLLMVNRLRQEHNAAQLVASEQRMRLFFERHAAGMAITSPTKGWLQVNDELCRMFGYSKEELTGLTWAELTHPDDLQADLDQFARLLSGSIDEYSMEKRFIHKNGSVVWTDLSVGCVRFDDGTVDYILALLVDITKRKKAQDELKTNEERLRLALAAANQGLYDLNVQTGEATVSPEYATMLGYDPADFHETNEKWIERLHPDDHEPVAAAYRDYIAGKISEYRVEFRQRTKPGDWKWILSLGKVVEYNPAGQPLRMLGTHTDITGRKQAEEEKQKLQAQLLQAQKMESVGRLAGGVAHDFNNMLQTILGYSDLSLAQVEATNPVHEGLLEIRKAAMRSADLTRQLLAFARKQTANPKIIDLNDTVSGMLKMLQRLIGEDIDLAWLPGHSLWPVKMDPSQLDQILANLAVNARDAIADTGKITIETENISLDTAYCTGHPDALPGKYVQLMVSDNGCGMDKETTAQIFEPFFTTKEQGKGTGLGLATVYGIVRQNNGFVNLYSEPGQGTTFSIYLPSFISETVPVAETSRTEEPLNGTETVLLVEDDAAILDLGMTVLQRLGYTVLAANTPNMAIQLAQEQEGEIHLLITDVIMPEMNGRELAQRLSSLRPTMQCLYMSGYTANVIAHHGVLDPGIHFIQKPFSIDALGRAVREALRDNTKHT